jgi:LysM repeat protein
MKESKKTIFKQSVILAGVACGLLLFSACSSTKVLDNNGDIPAPSLTPPENANQVVTQELQTQSVISTPEQPEVIQTATSVPGFQEGVEGKVKYTVKKGDSLWKVSKMFDVSVRELAAYNNMDINRGLKVGTILQIPPSGLAAPKVIAVTPTATEKHKKHINKVAAAKKTIVTVHSGNGANYIVKKGDSFKSIAKKYGITVKELVAANQGLTEKSKVKAGQKLNIPAKGEKIEKTTAVVDTKTAPPTEAKQTGKALNDLINSDVVDTSKPTDNKAQAAGVAPAATTSTTEQKPAAAIPNYLPHTVKDGDTWQTISDMYGLSVDDLKKANPSGTGEPKVGTTVNIPEE